MEWLGLLDRLERNFARLLTLRSPREVARAWKACAPEEARRRHALRLAERAVDEGWPDVDQRVKESQKALIAVYERMFDLLCRATVRH